LLPPPPRTPPFPYTTLFRSRAQVRTSSPVLARSAPPCAVSPAAPAAGPATPRSAGPSPPGPSWLPARRDWRTRTAATSAGCRRDRRRPAGPVAAAKAPGACAVRSSGRSPRSCGRPAARRRTPARSRSSERLPREVRCPPVPHPPPQQSECWNSSAGLHVGDAQPGVRLVAPVDGDEVGGERLDLVGVAQATAVDAPHPGDRRGQLPHHVGGFPVVAEHEHVQVDLGNAEVG